VDATRSCYNPAKEMLPRRATGRERGRTDSGLKKIDPTMDSLSQPITAHPSPLTAANCEQCGKPFKPQPRGKTRAPARFCSRACYYAATPRSREIKTCLKCQGEFEVKQSHAERRRYCSYACMGAAYKEQTGAANHNFRGRKQEYTCAACGEVFQSYPSRSKNLRFCSRECRGAGITLTCQGCGVIYRKPPSRSGSRYCSQTCKHKFARTSAPSTPRTKACARCGKCFHVPPSEFAKTKFCSHACAYPPRTINCETCGKLINRPRLAQRYCNRACVPIRSFERPCDRCGESFLVEPSQANTARFCSRDCQNQRILKDCAFCGAIMEVVPTRADVQRFCDLKCYAKWQSVYKVGENSPSWTGGKRAAWARSRVRRGAAIKATITENISRTHVILTYGHHCYICNRALTRREISIDHVIPLSRGGSHTLDNLRVCCKSCNSRKYNRLLSEFVSLLPLDYFARRVTS